MLRAVKIRLYPNKTQTEQFNKLLGCYRFVYNQCLARKINSYRENKVSENLSTLGSSPTEFTLVDYPTMDDRSVMNLKSSDRMNQEVDKEQGLTLFKFQ